MEKRELILEAKGICKRFGPTVALQNVDLSIYGGDVQGLIGENGSGKNQQSHLL